MTPLDKALKRLAEIQREEAELRQFIAMYQRFDGVEAPSGREPVLVTQINGNEAGKGGNNPVDNAASRHRRARSDGPSPKEIAELMERVIREAGRPLSRGEILDALERREINILAKDKSRYVGTIAWRNKATFINIEGRGYWLRGEIPRAPGVAPNTPYYDPPEETSDELPLEE